MTTLLLSVKPEYGQKILIEKTKKVELRKVRTKVKTGDTIVFYVTTPVCAICGTAIVKDVQTFNCIDQLWNETKNINGIESQKFWDYYKEAKLGLAIYIENPTKFSVSIPLETMQKLSIQAPQSYRYLNDLEYKRLLGLVN